MFKELLIGIFLGKRILMNSILAELQGIHYHLDRMEEFYKMVNKIEEDEEKIKIGDTVFYKNQEDGKNKEEGR